MPFNFDSLTVVLTPEQRLERLKNAIYMLKKQGRPSEEINALILGDRYLSDATEQEMANAVAELETAGMLTTTPP